MKPSKNIMKSPSFHRWAGMALLALTLPATTLFSADTDGIQPEDYQWWRDARFGIFIH